MNPGSGYTDTTLPADEKIRLCALQDAVRVRIMAERDYDVIARRGVELKREVKPTRIDIARIKDHIGRRLRIDEVRRRHGDARRGVRARRENQSRDGCQ